MNFINDLKNFKILEKQKKDKLLVGMMALFFLFIIFVIIIYFLVNSFLPEEKNIDMKHITNIDENIQNVFDDVKNEDKSIDIFNTKNENITTTDTNLNNKYNEIYTSSNTENTEVKEEVKITEVNTKQNKKSTKIREKTITTEQTNQKISTENYTEKKEINSNNKFLFVKKNSDTKKIDVNDAKCIIMDTKKYKNGEQLRLRILQDYKIYKKNDIVFARINFSNDRIFLVDEKNSNIIFYDKDGNKGIRLNVDLSKIQQQQEMERGIESSSSNIANSIGSSIAGETPIVGNILSNSIQTGYNVAKTNIKDPVLEILIEQGTFLFIE